MGLRINTNIPSITALRNLQRTDRATQKNLEQLSTGLRINRGGDDPSGLVISEQLRSQISAIDQARENARAGGNLITVAEAALQEVSDILIRIQEATLFAQNTGANSAEQIAAEQDGVDQAIAAIDRIAASTRFGERPLLNGTSAYNLNGAKPDLLDDLTVRSVMFPSGLTQQNFTFVVTRNPQRAQVQLNGISAVPAGTILRVTGPRGSQDIALASGSRGTELRLGINAVAGYTGVFASGTTNVGVFSEEFGDAQRISLELMSGNISAAAIRFLSSSGSLTTFTGALALSLDTGSIINDSGLDGRVRFQGAELEGVGRSFKLNGPIAKISFRLDPELLPVPTTAASATITVANTGMIFQVGALPFPSDRISVGIDGVFASMLGSDTIRDRIEEATAGVSTGSPLANQIFRGGFARSMTTGNSNDLFTNPGNGGNIIRAAITQLGLIRGFLGGVHADNLEPAQRSAEVSVQNLSSSLSDIRDLDFARGTAEFVRNQILFQSGISVLASANSIPQAVLSLLQT